MKTLSIRNPRVLSCTVNGGDLSHPLHKMYQKAQRILSCRADKQRTLSIALSGRIFSASKNADSVNVKPKGPQTNPYWCPHWITWVRACASDAAITQEFGISRELKASSAASVSCAGSTALVQQRGSRICFFLLTGGFGRAVPTPHLPHCIAQSSSSSADPAQLSHGSSPGLPVLQKRLVNALRHTV